MKLILASSSPRRKELMDQTGWIYEVIPSTYEEKDMFKTPEKMVKKYSLYKALDVANKAATDAIVIGADTIVYMDKVMGKPADKEDAIRMLTSLSGREHFVMTGITVINNETKKISTACEKTKVKFKPLTQEEIQGYVIKGEPMGKAGAYAIQGQGALFVEKIEGCYFNIVGLPLFRLSELLGLVGYVALGRKKNE